MIIGGFQRFSLIDYPRKICAIIFTQGCNFRCPYCHNPELVNPKLFQKPINQNDILRFLKTRREKLDAVEITGGEPTLQIDLVEFMEKIKDLGFLIKIDTNGSNPDVLKAIINHGLVDYIAMDVKAPLRKYNEVTRTSVSLEKIKKSIGIIMDAGIKYEFRTTVVRSLLSKEDIIDIGKLVKGAELYILQKFIPSKVLDPIFLNGKTYSDKEFRNIKRMLEKFVRKCLVR